jgi:hypothetical protein
VHYLFEWDPAKAITNQRRHGIRFERAATIFQDPSQISIYDEEHSSDEDRWVTLGMDAGGTPLVVVHTFRTNPNGDVTIRLISARRATRREAQQYAEFR